MLKYTINESSTSSHFFITTQNESLHLLSFSKVEEEEIDFDDAFLQKNALQMTIARLSEPREVYCTALSETIKNIFDTLLFKKDDCVIYLSVTTDSCKDQLIQRFIDNDTNDQFTFVDVIVDDITFYFFFNNEKTNIVECISSINNYFKKEYDINLMLA